MEKGADGRCEGGPGMDGGTKEAVMLHSEV